MSSCGTNSQRHVAAWYVKKVVMKDVVDKSDAAPDVHVMATSLVKHTWAVLISMCKAVPMTLARSVMLRTRSSCYP